MILQYRSHHDPEDEAFKVSIYPSEPEAKFETSELPVCVCQCVSLFVLCNRHWFNKPEAGPPHSVAGDRCALRNFLRYGLNFIFNGFEQIKLMLWPVY
jgi:hypothetical protein